MSSFNKWIIKEFNLKESGSIMALFLMYACMFLFTTGAIEYATIGTEYVWDFSKYLCLGYGALWTSMASIRFLILSFSTVVDTVKDNKGEE